MPKTRKVGKYLELKGNTWMVFMDVPKDLRKHFGKARLKKSLETSDAGLAEMQKTPWVMHWKMQFRLLRTNPDAEVLDVPPTLDGWRKYLNDLGPQNAEWGAAIMAHNLNPFAATFDVSEQRNIAKIYAGAQYLMTGTADYLEEFFDYAKYAPEVHIEGKRYMVDVFTKMFPTFETIKTDELVAYCDVRLRGTDGKQPWSRVTLRKNLNFAKKYWEYCAQRYTSAPNLIDYDRILPKEIKTKATRKSSDEANKAYSVDEVYLLLDAAVKKAEETNRHGDHNLVDLIRLGMYTGCRIEELCQMKLADVTADSFIIRDSKTESGQRLVPMHKEVSQIVERLKQSSTDGFLLSGESTANATGKRSKGLSQRFSRHKQDLGFENKLYTFHSFRSTLAKRFESAGVEEIRAARIIGHKVKSMTYGIYSRGTDWDVLFTTMNEKISFPRSA